MTRSPISDQFKKELNPAQLEAVMFDQGPLLVIAGAGSGKTRTLTYRVARLVEEGLSPASLLLLTFTRKASQEMLRRASALLDDRCEKVAGGTFHSFANMVLRRHGSLVGLDPSFTIMDRPDMESLLGTLRKDMGLAPNERTFPRKQTLAGLFSRSVNKLKTIEDVIFDDYPHFSRHMDALVTLYEAYVHHKQTYQLVDYDDLLVYLNRLLTEQEEIRRRLCGLYQYVMVDEYQDTNRIQADIVRRIVEGRNNIMVVGDDSQSIYAFRGADVNNILSFPEIYPGATVIKLEENYRSVPPILDLANAVIDKARHKYTKNLFSNKRQGMVPTLVCTLSENEQSRFVVEKIHELITSGVDPGRIAVLFRAGFHSFDLEIQLGKAGISFVKYGGFKFMDAAHIKDVLAHLKVIHNPGDSISWLRILTLLNHVGAKTAGRLFDSMKKIDADHRGLSHIDMNQSQLEHTKRLRALFADLDPAVMTVVDMGEAVMEYYLPMLEEKFDDHPKRKRDLEQLLAIMEGYPELEQFLSDMAIEPPSTSLDNNLSTAHSDIRRLVLSTVHSAKGLEWHTVFVIWALDGRFPSMQALNKDKELEEELRLMYVAATRAKEHLLFLCPAQAFDRATGMLLNRPSRFLEDIPEDILNRHSVW